MSTIKVNNLLAVNDALRLAMEKDKRVVVFGEDVGHVGGVFRATKGLQKAFGSERCFDSVLDEATIMGTAIGLALNDMRPVCELQFQGFSYGALQNLFGHAARYRNRTRSAYSCPLVVRMPVGGDIRAIEHHSEAIEALYAHIPGLKVVMPSNPYDTKGLLLAAINDQDPVVFLEPKKIYRAFEQEIPADYYEVEIGKARILQSGDDLTIVSYGASLYKILAAIKDLNNKDNIEIIDLRTIKPWDQVAVINSVKKTGRLMVVHEAVKSFSVAAEIIATVVEKCLYYLKAVPIRVTPPDITIPLDCGEKWFKLTPEKIAAKIITIMNEQY